MNAFPKETERIAQLVRETVIDFEAFMLPLKACDLADCRGTCCHDGVYLSGEEAEVVQNVDPEKLKAVGAADLPGKTVIYGNWRGLASGPKTATRPAPMRERVKGYPSHFPETNCVFLLPDARCALQALAVEEGKQPWFYKPFTCWVHPLAFQTNEEGNPLLT
ncbi:MAG: hypothetical protein HKN23_19370, partial [Verrucomicrobiales bacterium]|nr:hypothetical protein [Verrucomicrobiales bacterium]